MVLNTNVKNSSFSTRKRWAKVWEDFIYHVKDGKEWARCKHCKKEFVGSSKSGTTHLRNHLKSCPCLRNPGGVVDKAKEKSLIDPELNGSDLVRKIIKYGIKDIKNDIVDVYQQEKDELRGYLDKLPCRFNVTIERLPVVEMWLMRIWFIDDSWERKDRIIFLEADIDDVYESVKSSLEDWSIDKKICSMIRSRSLCDEKCDEKEEEDICNWFNERGSLSFTGICLPVSFLLRKVEIDISFYALAIISRNDILTKLNSLTDYARTNENKFQSAVEKAVSMGKTVTSKSVPSSSVGYKDVLEWVMGCKEALCELEDTDPDFKSINFIKEDWDEAALMYNCFKVLEDLSQELSNLLNCKYNTAKVDFPMFCDIFLKLVQLGKSDNHYFCFLVSRFRKYFDEFWNKSKLVLVITGILDPQFKMSFNVENFYKEMYGNDAKAHFNRMVDDVANIFNQYAKGTNNSMSSSSQELEFNCYLSDPKCPSEEGFDILQWWHFNSSTYPILARMARDFLSIPISAIDEDDSLVKEIKCVYDCLDDDFKLKFAYTKIWFNNLENN